MKVRIRIKRRTIRHVQERELSRERAKNLTFVDASASLSDDDAGRVLSEAEFRQQRPHHLRITLSILTWPDC